MLLRSDYEGFFVDIKGFCRVRQQPILFQDAGNFRPVRFGGGSGLLAVREPGLQAVNISLGLLECLLAERLVGQSSGDRVPADHFSGDAIHGVLIPIGALCPGAVFDLKLNR